MHVLMARQALFLPRHDRITLERHARRLGFNGSSVVVRAWKHPSRAMGRTAVMNACSPTGLSFQINHPMTPTNF